MSTNVSRWLFLLGLCASVVGCASANRDYCEAKSQCVGGNDADVDACVAEKDAEEDVASAYDCSDAWSNYIDCKVRTGNCEKGSWSTNCDDEDDALKKCQDAASALD